MVKSEEDQRGVGERAWAVTIGKGEGERVSRPIRELQFLGADSLCISLSPRVTLPVSPWCIPLAAAGNWLKESMGDVLEIAKYFSHHITSVASHVRECDDWVEQSSGILDSLL